MLLLLLLALLTLALTLETLLSLTLTLLSGAALEALALVLPTRHRPPLPLVLALVLVLAALLALTLALSLLTLRVGSLAPVLLFLPRLKHQRSRLTRHLDAALSTLQDGERGSNRLARTVDLLELDKGAGFASDELDRGDFAKAGGGGAESGLVDRLGTRGARGGPVGELTDQPSSRTLM